MNYPRGLALLAFIGAMLLPATAVQATEQSDIAALQTVQSMLATVVANEQAEALVATATAVPNSTSTATPTPTPTPVSLTATSTAAPAATATAIPATATATPTNTPAPPTATATAVPTSGFVSRPGAQLRLNGAPFRYAGGNLWWLGMLDNGTFPSHADIDNGFWEAQQMSATAVRTFGALTVGCTNCLEPTLGAFTDANFDRLDYAVSVAKQDRIHLVMSLVDQNVTALGGINTYVGWRGLSNSDFFTNASLISDYEAHIAHVLLHVNPYTGLAYKDDPTIMAWETGNELATSDAAWTHTIASYIKSVAPNQLVMDGYYGVLSGSNTDVADTATDILQNHTYDNYRTPSVLSQEADVAHQNNHAYVVGEYSWNGLSADNPPQQLTWNLGDILPVLQQKADGDTFWQLQPTTLGYCADWFTIHVPADSCDANYGVSQSQMAAAISSLTSHAQTMAAGDTL
jgi:hypothetical protein